jgi:hypothetical protein
MWYCNDVQILNTIPKVRWVVPREVTRIDVDGTKVTVILDQRQRRELQRAHRIEVDLIKLEDKRKRAKIREEKKMERLREKATFQGL